MKGKKIKPHPITFIQSEINRINFIVKQLEDIMTGKENKKPKMKPLKAFSPKKGSKTLRTKDSERAVLQNKRTGKLKTGNTPRKYSEHNLQVECVRWFRYQYPKYLIFSIPNERKVSPIAGKRFKDAGRVSGVPDLFLAFPSYNYHGMFIEMKSDNGKLNDNQKAIQKTLSINYKVATCFSFDEFKNVVNDYFK
jgi:hypothetical protein